MYCMTFFLITICFVLLIYIFLIFRIALKELQIFSSTDVQCLWAEKKAQTDCWYSTVPIRDFCCLPTLSLNNQPPSEEEKAEKRKRAMELFPSSAIAKHMKMRRTEMPNK